MAMRRAAVMRLSLLISVPNAGLTVPPEVGPYCKLTDQETAEDGDEGAVKIYNGLRDCAAAFVTTRIDHYARQMRETGRLTEKQ